MDFRAREIHPRSDPPDAGTEHLGGGHRGDGPKQPFELATELRDRVLKLDIGSGAAFISLNDEYDPRIVTSKKRGP